MPDFVVQVISGVHVGRKFKITQPLTLGRSPENVLCFTGPDGSLVSSKHAVIETEGDNLIIRDLGSTNGTWVNGERINEAYLQADQIVSLGQNGPKLRMVGANASATETTTFKPQNPATPPPAFGKGSQTQGRTKLDSKAWQPPPGFGGPPAETSPEEAGSYTIGLAHRIRDDEADHDEMQKVMKDHKRAARLASAGILSQKEARMISQAAHSHSKSRRGAIITISVIVAVSLVVVSFLAWQNMGYRGELKKQQSLISNVQQLESQLAHFQSQTVPANPDAVVIDHEKELLVAKLRAAERQLVSVRTNLQSKDIINTYKNPLGREIHQILQEFGKRDYIVPDIFINQVQKHINTFTKTSSRRIIERSFENKPMHRHVIESELLKQGMPLAFFYLAMHESLLDSVIVSKAGARGLWQFMPATARQYGLSVPANWEELPHEADERTNPRLATPAGVKYLKVLYAEFGDVALAMAAYNAGEGRIRAALRKIDDPVNNRDFWYIYRMGILASETNEYVPKIIATMILDRNRERYGFTPDRS
jgi:Transglycosylase SLT domain/FHA domain